MSKRPLFRCIIAILFLLYAGSGAFAADPKDRKGTTDPPVFSRMQGFHISQAEVAEFDRTEFLIAPGKQQAIEGRRYKVWYDANEQTKTPSGLQVTRNYANANSAAGGQTVYEYEDGGMEYVVLKLLKGGNEYWTRVEAASNRRYHVLMVVREAMRQDVTANAEAWAGRIRESGKATVYGIHFDTGRSEIKPESEAVIGEIAKLLKSTPSLKLHLVGHTDAVGTLPDNMKLSQSRAAAVVAALVAKHGIPAARLAGHGVGPLAPVAPNDTDEGRAKNRRVELVKQ
jgi:OmpA-OmpF porin, OOP family